MTVHLAIICFHTNIEKFCQAFMEVIFLHPAIICKTTLHFRGTEPNYVMAGTTTIDHLERYQLGDLSWKIVTLQA